MSKIVKFMTADAVDKPNTESGTVASHPNFREFSCSIITKYIMEVFDI